MIMYNVELITDDDKGFAASSDNNVELITDDDKGFAASSDNNVELITDDDKGFELPKHVLEQRRCQEAQQHRRKVWLKVHQIQNVSYSYFVLIRKRRLMICIEHWIKKRSETGVLSKKWPFTI